MGRQGREEDPDKALISLHLPSSWNFFPPDGMPLGDEKEEVNAGEGENASFGLFVSNFLHLGKKEWSFRKTMFGFIASQFSAHLGLGSKGPLGPSWDN